jgi:aminodeoxyfutalosine synthase
MHPKPSDTPLARAEAAVASGCRVSAEDAVELARSVNLIELGALAHARRLALHDSRAYFVSNLHINLTNICVNRCGFCAYRKDKDSPGAYVMSPEEVWRHAETRAPRRVAEFHIVSGLNPELRLADLETILKGLRERWPNAALKAFTAVEIDFIARNEGLDPAAVLTRLKAAGLQSLTGGGAEIFSPRARRLLCPEKLDAEGWLATHRLAHGLGLSSTATMLFGHVESLEERVDHLVRLRALQDETRGFSAFVPLVFHPENTQLSGLPRATGRLVLETVALARLLLDNIPHIKAYWVSLGQKTAQLALHWGADDLDGTVVREQIHDSAGAQSAAGLTGEALRRLIRDAGFHPVERDGFYRPIHEAPAHKAKPAGSRPADHSDRETRKLLDEVAAGERRLNAAEADWLLARAELHDLARAAHAMRKRLHPEPAVTYNVDRNINTSNGCESLCEFCAFARPVNSPQVWRATREEIAEKIDELYQVGDRLAGRTASDETPRRPKPQVLMQGGLDPALDIRWYLELFRWMRERWPDLHIHALSPPEIRHLAERAGVGWSQAIRLLREAGLDSIPGGGAEILCDRVRRLVSPNKCDTADWIGVMRVAHHEGLRSTATMVIGLGEFLRERIEHLERLRALQDETGGFTAFIPWTFQASNTPLLRKSEEAARSQANQGPGPSGQTRIPVEERFGASGIEYLRLLAVSRLFLDNIPNLQASWVTQGAEIAQTALLFGANDLGGAMLEENVVAAAGTRFRLSVPQLESLITDLGMRPTRRDYYYNTDFRQP